MDMFMRFTHGTVRPANPNVVAWFVLVIPSS